MKKQINYHKIQITHLCNDNCIFCYDKGNKKYGEYSNYDFSKKNVFYAIKKGFKKGYLNYIILTGGEATTDINIIDYIRYAKNIGFDKIEVISNGVKFANYNFCKKIIEAGLTGVNISVHGHNSNIHNYLTGNKIAFQSIIKGIINLKKINNNLDFSIYIVINRFNLKYLNNIILYFKRFGIYEYHFLQLIPFGNILKNEHIYIRNLFDLYYEIKKIINLYKNTNITINISHLVQPNILEGNENKISNIEVNIIKDIELNLGMNWKKVIKEKKFIRCNNGKFCNLCYLNSFCNQLDNFINKSINIKSNININNNYYLDNDDLPNNYSDFLKKIKGIKNRLINLPPCIIGKNFFYDNFYDFLKINKNNYNYKNFIKYFKTNGYLVKSLRCGKCKYNEKCNGVHIKIIKKYGFYILKPFIQNEISLSTNNQNM